MNRFEVMTPVYGISLNIIDIAFAAINNEATPSMIGQEKTRVRFRIFFDAKLDKDFF